MKNNLTCEIVEDLMPSYIDGLTNEVTNSAVREHLSHCGKCNAKLDNMSEPCSEDKIEQEKKEIDFLKKNRRKNIRTKLISLLAVVIVVAVAVTSLPYMIRNTAGDGMIAYDLEVDGDTFNIKATADQNYAVITDLIYTVSDMGTLDIAFEFREKTALDNDKVFKWSLTSPDVKSVVCQGKVLWEDGEYISPVTSAVYKNRTPYIGDMSHNQQIASALGLYHYIGSFSNALYTKAEPYGWEIIVTDPIMPVTEKEKAKLMKNYSYALLGVIVNLSYVTFSYDIFNSNGEDIEKSITVTKEEASEFFGEDIKKCSEDINNLQRLMKKTGLSDIPYAYDDFEVEINQTIKIELFNLSEAPINKIEFFCPETEDYTSQGFVDDSIFNIDFGKKPIITATDFDVRLNRLSKNAYDESRLGSVTVEITVYDWDDKAYKVEDTIEVSAFKAANYNYTLDGTFEEGFTVKIK